MKNILLLSALLIISKNLSAQVGQELLFGTSFWDLPHQIMLRPDGSLSAISTYGDSIPGELGHVLLYHVSPSGEVLDQKEIARNATSLFVEAEADGTFWLGRLDSTGYRISRHSPEGTLLSKFTYTHPHLWDDYYFAIRRIPGKGFALAFANANITTPGVRVVSLSETGAVAWSRFIPSQFPDFYNNGLAVLANGYIVVAVVDFSQGYQVVCYSPTGSMKWLKGMPQVPSFAEDFGLVPVGTDRVVLYGNGGNNTYNGFAGCYDASGNFVWNRTFETEAKNLYLNTGFADEDQTILAGEYFNSSDFGLAVLKFDAQGNMTLKKLLPALSGQKDNLTGTRISNGDYVFGGFQWDPGSIGSISDQGFALSLHPQGNTNWLLYAQTKVRLMRSILKDNMSNLWLYGQDWTTSAPSPNPNNFLWKIGGGVPQVNPMDVPLLPLSPNPAAERVYVECPAHPDALLTLEARNSTGGLTQRIKVQTVGGQASVAVNGWLPGIYWLTLRNESGAAVYQGKLAVHR